MGVQTREDRWATYDVSVAPAQVNANTTSEQTFTLRGLKAATVNASAGVGGTGGVILACSKPTHQAGLGIVNVRISANDTLAITYMNNTASPITPTTEVYRVHYHLSEMVRLGVNT